jgi:hypothetical protein
MVAYDAAVLAGLVDDCFLPGTNRQKELRSMALAEYVFGNTAFFVEVDKTTLSGDKSQETDLEYLNLTRAACLGGLVIVEVRNRQQKFSTQDVDVLAAKVKARGETVGLLVCRESITGTKRPATAGWAAVFRHLMERIHILCVTFDDLRNLGSDDELLAFLMEKYVDAGRF